MSDHLFDPMPYGPGRAERGSREEPETIRSNGRWVLLTSLKSKPSSVDHRLTGGHNQYGGWSTECGLVGNPITLEVGTEMVPCARCRKK